MNQQQPPYGSQMGWGGQDGQINAYGQGWNPSMQQQQQPQQPADQSKYNLFCFNYEFLIIVFIYFYDV